MTNAFVDRRHRQADRSDAGRRDRRDLDLRRDRRAPQAQGDLGRIRRIEGQLEQGRQRSAEARQAGRTGLAAQHRRRRRGVRRGEDASKRSTPIRSYRTRRSSRRTAPPRSRTVQWKSGRRRRRPTRRSSWSPACSASRGESHDSPDARRRRLRPAADERLRVRSRGDLQAGRRAGEAAVDARRRHAARLLSRRRLPLLQGRRRRRRQAGRLVGSLHHVQPGRSEADQRRRSQPGRISRAAAAERAAHADQAAARDSDRAVARAALELDRVRGAIVPARMLGRGEARSPGVPAGGHGRAALAAAEQRVCAEHRARRGGDQARRREGRLGQARCRRAAGSGSRSTSATPDISPKSPRSASTRTASSRCTG